MEEALRINQAQQTNEPEILDNSGRAKLVILVFWILIGVTAIAVISDYLELKLLQKARFGGITEAAANANDMRQGIMGVVQTGIYIVSVVVFLNWFRRAYANLHRLGINYLKHNKNMALWSWFIPFIFLFWPVQIMREIWSETQRVIRRRNSSYIIKSGGLIIGAWWALFVLSNFIGKYVLNTSFKTDTLEQLILSTEAYLISDLLQIPEALLVILIVHRLSKMERKMAEEVENLTESIRYSLKS